MPDLYRVVFWDFDGTLARRHNLWSGALVDAWRSVKQSADVSVADLRPHLGAGFPWHDSTVIRQPQSADEWWAALRPVLVGAYVSAGLDPAHAEKAVTRVPAEFYRPDAWTLVDGAVAALRTTAAAGYRNVILSNHPPELPTLVDALGLTQLVEDTITSAAVGAEKPNPAIFAHAIRSARIINTDDIWRSATTPSPTSTAHGTPESRRSSRTAATLIPSE